MSDVVLATRLSPENYPKGLDNLAKRFESNDDNEAIHYSELGFGDISDEIAKITLRFFGDIGLIDNPKGANYRPPESVVQWKLKIGQKSQDGKEAVRDSLQNYDVFKDTEFILQDGDKELEALATEVGGIVGIDEDEISDMKRTIKVFVECGFFQMDEDYIVSLPNGASENGSNDSHVEEATEEGVVETTTDTQANTGSINELDNSGEFIRNIEKQSSDIHVELDITLDANDIETEEFRKKLEAINEILGNDRTKLADD